MTDRAKRYRAQSRVTGPKRCVICGGRQNLGVMHLSGNESDGEPANLAYGCKSCNGKLGAAFKRIGAGKPTNQYNPASNRVPTYEQYKWAVTHHTRGEHDEGGVVIHATPKHKRIEYAKRIAAFAAPARRAGAAQRRADFDDRWNPAGKVLAYSKDLSETASLKGPFRRVGGGRPVKVLRKSGKRLFVEVDDYGSSFFGWVDPEDLEKSNPWPFSRPDARQTTPASGGIAHHSKRGRANDLNALFLKAKSAPAGRYRGYTIGKTPEGEFFSSLDTGSWYETKAKVQRAIDAYLKGRANPSKVLYIGTARRKGNVYVPDVYMKGGEPEDIGSRLTGPYGHPAIVAGSRIDATREAKAIAAELNSTPRAATKQDRQLEERRAAYEAQKRLDAIQRARRNPAGTAAEVFEEFHGFAPSEVVTVTKKVFHHEHLAAAGKLTHLEVWGIDGKGHKISGFKGALLAFNEGKNQLFAEGGDQSVNLGDFGIKKPHELETLGRLTDIGYQTNKTHLGDEGGEAVYVHKFRTTNDNGRHVVVKIARYPDLIYDVRNEQLLFSGGSYEILREGINK